MKTVVVTGGAGFVGSHLCEALSSQGSAVICVDSLVTGREENVERLLEDKNFSLVRHDITKAIDLKEGIDQVYNLASPASPKDFSRIPIEILLTNSVGTRNALELAVSKKARFLQASTSEVYGQPLEHPQKETYFGNVNSIGERSCYDEGKRFSEALVTAYSRKKSVDARIARIFNTYGPRMRKDDGRVTPNFITQALSGKPITIYGNGSQTRSFCFVTDLVAGLIKLMNSDYKKPVNLGNPNEITVKQFAEKILEISKSKSKLVFAELPKDDPARRQPDISVARAELGGQPTVSLEDGLAKTIDWFKDN